MRQIKRVVLELKRMAHRPGPDEMPAPPARQRLLVAAAAVAITLVIGVLMVGPHLDFLRARREAAVPKPCAPGQTSGCVGGTMSVIVAPAAASR